MEAFYSALLNDEKTIIDKSSFELIKAIPDTIKLIIKTEFDRHVKVGLNEGDLFAHTAVDFNGNYKPIELNNFIIVDLGTDIFGKYSTERNTVVKEKRTGECRSFHSVGAIGFFIVHTLMPLIHDLENAFSWETIDKFKELGDIKKENEQLKIKIKSLEAQISSLSK
ncbi:hypothetical protein MTO98_33735 [Mucilaginibacter sp. SMC90]|uniref:hypothetical protein n=1 Tax=Mucilaginibacter sp. SMC90 TaxID=2929803 RepID=UPI001FB1FB38|nr:hypothetical protein [Mucilaginibacter sp. SMC90]UOE49358.1 hypothetical protein MTO98_33735 [Mucilaginibacter sp. SMC90]